MSFGTPSRICSCAGLIVKAFQRQTEDLNCSAENSSIVFLANISRVKSSDQTKVSFEAITRPRESHSLGTVVC